ncbi:hypothetical protein GJ744_004803 [Endocarpon pusillum]|uniref:Uncharacterized protein n=1 Tax=Endocarpon pusillum TaxID=364733 RepID=A0A8H7A959_9EURO|nr:hypothetical protein GJ744_004803 [Endocarpon pusillum]
MASKCWFVLKQTHYPPPILPKNGTGRLSGSGPICLGHLIPDLKHLDDVINRHGPLDIPPDMPIYPTKAWNLTWEVKKNGGMDISGKGGVPIAAAAGLTIEQDAGVAFKRTTQNFWKFKSLDTAIFQPTSEYVEDSVEDDEVVAYLEKRGLFRSSTLFMITGIIVARGTKSETSEFRKRDFHGGLGVEFPEIAGVGIDVSAPNETVVSSTAQKTTDFVWAVRLAKISKGLIDRQWSHETFSSGATFGLDNEAEKGQHIVDALQGEGLEGIEKVKVKVDDDVFVIGTDSGEMSSIP